MSTPHAVLRFSYGTVAEAERVEASLRADDDAFVRTRREGPVVILECGSNSIRSLLRSLDDALACASVAEDIIKTDPMGADDA